MSLYFQCFVDRKDSRFFIRRNKEPLSLQATLLVSLEWAVTDQRRTPPASRAEMGQITEGKAAGLATEGRVGKIQSREMRNARTWASAVVIR